MQSDTSVEAKRRDLDSGSTKNDSLDSGNVWFHKGKEKNIPRAKLWKIATIRIQRMRTWMGIGANVFRKSYLGKSSP
jgi:hypothetical protein